MTGCLYVSPWVNSDAPELGVVPLLLADTVASYKPTYRPPGGVPIAPSNFSADHHGKPSSISLVRKLQIIGDAAVALAGDGKVIADALYELRREMPNLKGQERPMRWLGDVANRANEIHGAGTMAAIGICALPNNKLNTMCAVSPRSLKHLGLCSAIGSGTEEIWDIVSQLEMSISENDFMDGEEKAIRFASAFNAKRLVHELRGEKSPDNWGGYVEWAYLDRKNKWQRGPREIHLFLEAQIDAEGRLSAHLVPHAIAYDPAGRILTLRDHATAQFVLDDGSIPDDSVDLEGFWTDWRPAAATVSIFTAHEAKGGHMTQTLYGQELADINFIGVGRNRGFGIEPRLFDHMGSSLAKAQGVPYKPLTADRIVPFPGRTSSVQENLQEAPAGVPGERADEIGLAARAALAAMEAAVAAEQEEAALAPGIGHNHPPSESALAEADYQSVADTLRQLRDASRDLTRVGLQEAQAELIGASVKLRRWMAGRGRELQQGFFEELGASAARAIITLCKWAIALAAIEAAIERIGVTLVTAM